MERVKKTRRRYSKTEVIATRVETWVVDTIREELPFDEIDNMSRLVESLLVNFASNINAVKKLQAGECLNRQELLIVANCLGMLEDADIDNPEYKLAFDQLKLLALPSPVPPLLLTDKTQPKGGSVTLMSGISGSSVSVEPLSVCGAERKRKSLALKGERGG